MFFSTFLFEVLLSTLRPHLNMITLQITSADFSLNTVTSKNNLSRNRTADNRTPATDFSETNSSEQGEFLEKRQLEKVLRISGSLVILGLLIGLYSAIQRINFEGAS